MTHKYKVGDNGKTRGGTSTSAYDYQILNVGEDTLHVSLDCGDRYFEDLYTLAGIKSSHQVNLNQASDLIPPKRRIKGWVVITIDDYGEPRIGTKVWNDQQMATQENAFACIEIDIEEGEGL